jgi:Mrp family chromosome partitioning ATPase
MSQAANALQSLDVAPGTSGVDTDAERRSRKADNLSLAKLAPGDEFVRLVYAVDALNTRSEPAVLQFVAATNGEGTSSVAAHFAATVSAARSRTVLLVNCNPQAETDYPTAARQRSSLIEAYRTYGAIDDAIGPLPGNPNVMTARLADSAAALSSLDPGSLRHVFDLARRNFSLVALDCPPGSTCPASLALARYCDGTLLVVRAEATSKSAVVETKANLERYGGQIIGTVLNRYKTYWPRWFRKQA